MSDPTGAIARLDEITRRLRKECPWDREQDERSIVPHTVEEAYELADAAHAGDDAKLLDELGDVLFQVLFLSLLMEERGAGDLAQVADGCREKLIRRHPHVFGDRAADTADDVVRNWGQIKRDDERGGEVFGEIPATLPSTLYAKRCSSAQGGGRPAELPEAAPRGSRRAPASRRCATPSTPARIPSSSLRRAADRYREAVERPDA